MSVNLKQCRPCEWIACQWMALGVALILPLGGVICAQSNLKIEGMGWFENRRLAARLAFLQGLNSSEPAELDATLLEDSSFILMEQVKQAGYLQPEIELHLWHEGVEQVVSWVHEYSIQLPVEVRADRATFQLRPGVLSYYNSVSVEGVTAFPEQELERYFIPGGVLIHGRRELAYTPANLNQRIQRLLLALKSEGYRSAQLLESEVERNEQSGAVQVRIRIDSGPLYVVGEVQLRAESGGAVVDPPDWPLEAGMPMTDEWEQAHVMELRNAAYAQGYPDAQVWMEPASIVHSEESVWRQDVCFVVDRGESVRLGALRFEGDAETERSVLKRQTQLAPGQPVNLLQVSEARRKLMALGIYRRVGFAFDPAEGPERDVVYELVPGQRKELSLQAGWGSYEMARVGFNWVHRNPWGRAHRYEIGAKQSFKSSQARSAYSVPQFLGTDLTAYTRAEVNMREELSYDRNSQSLAIGATTYLQRLGLQLSLEYGLSHEDTDRRLGSSFKSEESATVSSLRLEASLDRRDDFLAPSAGYNVFASFESAHPALGGTVDFQKLELGTSYHFSLTESIIVHVGLRGGTIVSSGPAEDNIPFNERFFLGGENSLRGYREGGAAPLDSNGDVIGAEVYLLGNLELEQRIWGEFSALLFVDVLSDSREGFYQQDSDFLYSVGLGLRYNTLMGPLRLEYGYNPQSQPNRPRDALHFSIGFPF